MDAAALAIGTSRDAILAALREAVALLTVQERLVVEARYGLDGRHPESLASLAERHGVSREMIRRIEAEGIRKLTPRLPEMAPSGTILMSPN